MKLLIGVRGKGLSDCEIFWWCLQFFIVYHVDDVPNTLSEVYDSPETERREQDSHDNTSRRLAVAWIVRRERAVGRWRGYSARGGGNTKHQPCPWALSRTFDGVASRSDDDVHDSFFSFPPPPACLPSGTTATVQGAFHLIQTPLLCREGILEATEIWSNGLEF